MTNAGREPSPEYDDRRPLARGSTPATRDAAQHRLARLRGRLIVGRNGLTGALSVVAAQAFPGKAISRPASSGSPSTSTALDAGSAAPATSIPPPIRPRSPLLVAVAALLVGCGPVASGAAPRPAHAVARKSHRIVTSVPRRPRIVTSVPRRPTAAFTVIVTVGGQPTAWIAQRGPATLMRFDQSHAGLVLHAGTLDPGSGPYRHGPRIAGSELRRVLAAFNGGFRLNTPSGGFFEDGHTAKPLTAGLGSVVIYRDGGADVGAWKRGVPAAGRPVVSVRQNLRLLVSDGAPAPTVSGCRICWGATLGGVTDVARSGIGITGAGDLVWVAGAHLSPSGLASALIGGGAVRAVELDINPEWVAGYVYAHSRAQVPPQPVVPGQFGVSGRFLTPYSRDFFAVLAR